MARTKKVVSQPRLRAAIEQAEAGGPLPTLSALWDAATLLYNAGEGLTESDAITPSVQRCGPRNTN